MNEGKKEWPMRPHTHRHIHTRTDTHTHTHAHMRVVGSWIPVGRSGYVWEWCLVCAILTIRLQSLCHQRCGRECRSVGYWFLEQNYPKRAKVAVLLSKCQKNNAAICDQNQFTMGQNQVVLRHLIMHFTTSSGVSKWANEQMNERNGVRKQSKQCGARDWVNCASKQANWRASGPVLLFWFLVVPGHSAVRTSVPCQNRIELARKAKKQP